MEGETHVNAARISRIPFTSFCGIIEEWNNNHAWFPSPPKKKAWLMSNYEVLGRGFMELWTPQEVIRFLSFGLWFGTRLINLQLAS